MHIESVSLKRNIDAHHSIEPVQESDRCVQRLQKRSRAQEKLKNETLIT